MAVHLRFKVDDFQSEIKSVQNPRVAVVGAGAWGKNIIRNYSEMGVLATICDIKGGLSEKYTSLYPDIHFTTTYSDVLNDDDTVGVVITTPAVTHYELAKQALLAKKHVYVEKPLALTVGAAQELVELSKKVTRVLMVGHILCYHPAVNKLKEIINSGELGNIKYIYSCRLNIGKIRTEENILWSFAPHDISVILYLLNEQPVSVYASGGGYVKNDVADVTMTMMDFPSGVKSHIFVSWLHPFKEQKLVVVGGKKMAVFDDLTEEKLFLYPHKINWQNRIPVAQKADVETVPVAMTEPLRIECQHFLDCISGKKVPLTDGNEGLRVLSILSAAQESLNNGSEKISLRKLGIKESRMPNIFVHPTAYVADGCKIGNDTKIWHNSQVQSGAQIGESCTIGHNCFVGSHARIGKGVKLESNVDVWDLVTLEDYVFIGPSAVFTNDITPRSKYPKKKYPKYGKWTATLVKEGASIGANATIVSGVTIGKYAFIGAGTVVKKDIPDYAIAVGVPAKVIGWMCECGTKLRFRMGQSSCPKCSCRYQRKNGKVFVANWTPRDLQKT